MSDAERHGLDRLEALFEAALELPPAERDAFLDEHLRGEPELREELQTLLGHASDDPDFLERLADRVVAPASGRALAEIQPRRLDEDLEGRYRIVREIGRGGMATVYLAQDLRHDRRVALKVLDPRLAAVLGPERFLAEIRTTANLQHPHILPLFDSGEAGGSLFYVMPYVEGESLRHKLDRERQLPVDEAVRIASEVAEALEHAHRKGVVHRDIKPANILLRDGKAMVADFGIALALGAAGGGRLTETGLSMGTPRYMSPEQATGEATVGSASDQWALGCVLFEMLAGEPPYNAATAQAILGRVLTEEPRAVRDRRPSVPAHVDAALRRSLEKVPADRFRSANEFARALRDPKFRHGPAVAGAMDRRAAPTPVLVGLLAVVSGLLLWQWAGGQRPGSMPVVRSFLPIPEGTGPGGWRGVDISDDGTRVSYISGGRIWTHRLSDDEAVPLQGTESAGGHVLSPDGLQVAFVDEGVLRKVPVGGGSPSLVATLGVNIQGGDWSEDGMLVYSTVAGLSLVSEDGGTPRSLTVTELPVQHTEPAFLPDGSGIVFTERGDSASPLPRIVVLGFDGERSVLTEDGHSGVVTADGTLVFGRDPGQLWAQRVGGDGRSPAGEPVLVLEGVAGTWNNSSRKSFAISGTGRLVYSPRIPPTRSEVVWVDRDGQVQVILDTEHPQMPRNIEGLNAARLSPDGSRIVFHGFSETGQPVLRLFAYDLDTRALTPIRVGADASWPTWEPEGERFLFNRGEGSDHEMYWGRPDNATPPEPFTTPNPEEQHAQWFSPDGQWVIVQQRPVVSANWPDLWLLPASGDGPGRPLVDGFRSQMHAGLDPDGRWLLYGSTESGQNEVYVTEFPEPKSKTHVSTERAFSPVWSPIGDEIFYRTWPTLGDAMMVVPVLQADSVFRRGTPEVLFDASSFHSGAIWYRSFDVTPDARRFLMTRDVGSETPPRIQMIQNWMAEVQERLASGTESGG